MEGRVAGCGVRGKRVGGGERGCHMQAGRDGASEIREANNEVVHGGEEAF